MQYGFQKITLSRILGIEQLQQLKESKGQTLNFKQDRESELEQLTCRTNFWSITFLPNVAWKSADSRKRRNTSYTSCRWGQDASSVGSSSSGSKSGFSLGGSVRNRFTDI